MIRDFHPLVFFYTLGVADDRGRLPARRWSSRSPGSGGGTKSRRATIVLVALLLVSGTQFTLFAMWFDQEANKELR